jgi:hypothetical protein
MSRPMSRYQGRNAFHWLQAGSPKQNQNKNKNKNQAGYPIISYCGQTRPGAVIEAVDGLTD